MARHTILGEPRGGMCGIGRRRVVSKMALVVPTGARSPFVHTTLMARGTRGGHVGACELEGRYVVVKRRRAPGSRRVAYCTCQREAGSRMRRVGGRRVVREMTGCVPTCAGCSLIHPVRMTRSAWRRDVRTCQRQRRLVMIECRRLPPSGGMARLTGQREA